MIALALLGYSGGVVAGAGKHKTPQPQIPDLVMVAVVFTITILLRILTDIGRWYCILAGAALGIAAGLIAARRHRSGGDSLHRQVSPVTPPGRGIRRYWNNWMSFSRRLGHFQNRIFLSYFFLIAASPVALLIKAFSDPLKIKKHDTSRWNDTGIKSYENDSFRRQY